MPSKQCQECKEIKNLSELSAKLEICQSCRTCENCNGVINDGILYYTLDESYKEKLTRCHFCLSKGDRYRQLRHYDLDRLLREARQHMNRNNNIFNKKDVENKLKDFKEGQDYSVSPTDDGKQIYNFSSDELKNFWGDDRIVVNRVVETDSNKDYNYYGQFENYQDGSYRSFQDPEAIGESLEQGKISEKHRVQDNSGFQPTCCHGCAENFQGKRDGEIIKSGSDEYFRRDPQQRGRMGRNEKGSFITDKEENGDTHSDLRKENRDLRQQLSEVQKQLAEVLEELKKLKSEVKGKESEKLSQQIVQNERLVKENQNISVAEVQEQVNKSQALMKEFKNVSSTKDNKGDSVLPYVIGGSVILA
ncbi:6296_t:CDS:2, partial [Funneliformis geosporum]